MMYKSFDTKIESGVRANLNEMLAEKLHKAVIKKFKNKSLWQVQR